MRLKYFIAIVLLIFLIRILYLVVVPVEVAGQIESDCFEEGCVVFEGDWINFKGAEYTHEVFTDDLSLSPQVPYVEYSGKLTKLGNFYYLNGMYANTKAYMAVSKSGEVSLLSIPWFFLYSISNYLPAYRHAQKAP